MVWLWLTISWVLVAVGVTLAVGRAVRLADRRAASIVPNFIVEIDPAETPLPPVSRAAADIIPEQAAAGSARLEAQAPSASRRRPRLRGAGTPAEKQSVPH